MLISAAFAIAIIAAVVIGFIRFEERRQMISTARAEGEQLGQVVIGLRGFIAGMQAEPSMLPAGEMSGINWLKAPSCGGLATNPAEGYVPCSMTGGRFSRDQSAAVHGYRTRFTRNAMTNEIEARLHFIVHPLGSGRSAGATNERAILLAEHVVQSAKSQQSNPNNGTFFNAFANVPLGATAPHGATHPGTNSGRVVVVVNNAPSQDIFLRTDGTNRMLANLDMGEMSIANALDGRFKGDVRVENRLQVDKGLTVKDGLADFQAGVVANEVLLTSIGKHVSEGIYDARVFTGANEYSIAKLDCTRAGNDPGIYAALQSTGTPNQYGYVADAIYESRVDVIDNGGHWTVRPMVQGVRFDLQRQSNDIVLRRSLHSVNASAARILVMRRCR